MFEPIHGSAFDIMGKGIANPIGTFWSGVMMLEHLGEKAAASAADARDRAGHGRHVAAHARPRRQGDDRAGHRMPCARRCSATTGSHARRCDRLLASQRRYVVIASICARAREPWVTVAAYPRLRSPMQRRHFWGAGNRDCTPWGALPSQSNDATSGAGRPACMPPSSHAVAHRSRA